MKDILDDFRNGRHEFENGRIDGIENLSPYALFEAWMTEAVDKPELEPNAFVLSTVNEDLQPTSRIVYIKEILHKEFVFYTNYSSKKGKDILMNNKVSMLFFWPKSARQIRIDGVCTKVASEISDAYFASRPRASQIGAWASHQSDVLKNRDELTSRIADLESKYKDAVPRPENWGGYQIKPTRFEFWQGRPSRLHDRVIFEEENETWNSYSLNP